MSRTARTRRIRLAIVEREARVTEETGPQGRAALHGVGKKSDYLIVVTFPAGDLNAREQEGRGYLEGRHETWKRSTRGRSRHAARARARQNLTERRLGFRIAF